ncbi:pyridoxamine 5'-phosphate oxidase family protein [Aeromicrobium sp.]|nr:pyridoxamine 5'-phosphate oxidase family protein [Candidatus Saccharibacteria bacterium]
MKDQRLMTVSTIHADGRPQAAVVQFAVMPDGSILMETSNRARKYPNLLADDRVACIIGWDQRISVQLEGTAQQVAESDVAAFKTVYLDKNPKARNLIDQPDTRLFKITPTWLRYGDYGSDPWFIEEFSL